MMNLQQIPAEVLLASGYAVFLLGTAAVLERLAIHSHRRTDQYELAGFRYNRDFDHWECPEGTHLVRVESDPMARQVRYRAPAKHCNACMTKHNCTDSDSGREIEHHLDLWLETGLGQFHHGISLALVVLAGLILAVEAIRHPDEAPVTLLAMLFLAAVVYGAKLISQIRARSESRDEQSVPLESRSNSYHFRQSQCAHRESRNS